MKIKKDHYYLVNDSLDMTNSMYVPKQLLIKVIDLDKYSNLVEYKIIAIKSITPDANNQQWNTNLFQNNSTTIWKRDYNLLQTLIFEEYTDEEFVVKYFDVLLKANK